MEKTQHASTVAGWGTNRTEDLGTPGKGSRRKTADQKKSGPGFGGSRVERTRKERWLQTKRGGKRRDGGANAVRLVKNTLIGEGGGGDC